MGIPIMGVNGLSGNRHDPSLAGITINVLFIKQNISYHVVTNKFIYIFFEKNNQQNLRYHHFHVYTFQNSIVFR